MRTREHFRKQCCSKLVIAQPNCNNLIEDSAWNLWKLTWKFRYNEAPQTAHKSLWVSSALIILEWRKRVTAGFSQLEGLSIAEHTITHSAETRTNTRWPVMRWFTRQWVTWRYLACASSPLLLHYFLKINGNYFPKSPRIMCNRAFRFTSHGQILEFPQNWRCSSHAFEYVRSRPSISKYFKIKFKLRKKKNITDHFGLAINLLTFIREMLG
jgi:hypothetical protein